MKLIKCPRCELNYMFENETMCSVCKKDVRGEQEPDDMIELCSECGENPVIPGQEVCAYCLKELQRRNTISSTDDISVLDPSSRDLDIDSVSDMEEIDVILPDDDGADFSEDDDTFKDEEEDPFAEDEDDDDDESEEDEV